MERICKTCKKEIRNLLSNFCSTTCFTSFSENRMKYLNTEYNLMIEGLDKKSPSYSSTCKAIRDNLILETKSKFNPMENEYQ